MAYNTTFYTGVSPYSVTPYTGMMNTVYTGNRVHHIMEFPNNTFAINGNPVLSQPTYAFSGSIMGNAVVYPINNNGYCCKYCGSNDPEHWKVACIPKK